MTVSSTISKVSYSGDDSTVSFPIPFNFTENADIVAVLADADGNETTWTITTDYTLTGAGGTSGGTLTAFAAPATGETLVIYRDPEIKQLVDYVENDPFSADTHEGALDKLTYICQALDEKVGRALLQPVTSSGLNVTFAPPDAGKVLLWNATGTAVTNGPDADQITSAQGYAEDARDAAEAAAASAATVPTFPAITGEGGKYVKINAGGTAIEYDALGTAAQVDTGTTSGTVPLLTTGGAMALAGRLDLSGASSGQIAFPATQNPSSDANTLDDYEEGTWTPIVVGTGTEGTGTYSQQTGHYTKIGRQVICETFLTWSAHTGTGNMKLKGLPFTSSGWTYHMVAGGFELTITGVAVATLTSGVTELILNSLNNGTIAPLAMDTAASMRFTVIYKV